MDHFSSGGDLRVQLSQHPFFLFFFNPPLYFNLETTEQPSLNRECPHEIFVFWGGGDKKKKGHPDSFGCHTPTLDKSILLKKNRSPKMGLPILLTPLLSAILWDKYRSPPFDALLVAVILVYRPLLCDETSYL